MTTPEAIKRRQRRISFALGFVLVFLIGLTWLGLKELSQRDDDLVEARLEFCQEVESIRSYVRDASTRAIESLPTVDYYRDHPDELAEAIDNLKTQRMAFQPALDCEAFSTGDPPIEDQRPTGQNKEET